MLLKSKQAGTRMFPDDSVTGPGGASVCYCFSSERRRIKDADLLSLLWTP